MNTIKILKKRINFITCALKRNFYARDFRTQLINYIQSKDIILKDFTIKNKNDMYYDFKLEFSHISKYHYRKISKMLNNAWEVENNYNYYPHLIKFKTNSYDSLLSAARHLINKLNSIDNNYDFRLTYVYGNEIHITSNLNLRELTYVMKRFNINKSFKLINLK